MKKKKSNNNFAIVMGFVLSCLICYQARAQQPIDCTQIYTYLDDFSIEITYDNFDPLVPFEICSGQAPNLRFSIKDQSGSFPTLNYTGVKVFWYYETSVSSFDIIPDGTDSYNFLLDAGDPSLSLDLCGVLPYIGSFDRTFKALIRVPDGFGGFCEHELFSDPLKICCPPGNITFSLNHSTDGTTFNTGFYLCESDDYVLKVNLNNLLLPFPDPGNNDVEIEWEMYDNNSNPITNFLVNPNGDELTWPDTGLPGSIAGLSHICVKATLSNCACPSTDLEWCYQITPEPQCASIEALPSPPNLTSSGTPGLYYICPGKDARIGILAGTGFSDCLTPQWEYSYPNTNPGVWHPTTGTTNLIHNTNILPASPPNIPPVLWPPGETCITYRINCPTWGNICPPCQTNEITICLIEELPIPEISANPNPFCIGNMTTLTIDNLANFSTGTTFEWYHNGLPAGTGSSLDTYSGGNYMVKATDQCGTVKSSVFQPDLCMPFAIISCPDPICPCDGQPITLDGSLSGSICSPVSFLWHADSGTQVSTSNDMPVFEHIPASGGTWYTLTITDTNGCQSTASTFVKPCEILTIPNSLKLDDQIVNHGQQSCFSALQTIILAGNGGWFLVEDGGSVELVAGQNIIMRSGTTVEHGGHLLARIAANIDDYCGSPKAVETFEEPFVFNETIAPVGFSDEVHKNGFFRIYPNPTDGSFTLELLNVEFEKNITLDVYALVGERLLSKELPPHKLHTISLEGHQPGIYIIRVIKGDRIGVERLMKR